jgi:hypothetical protein
VYKKLEVEKERSKLHTSRNRGRQGGGRTGQTRFWLYGKATLSKLDMGTPPLPIQKFRGRKLVAPAQCTLIPLQGLVS